MNGCSAGSSGYGINSSSNSISNSRGVINSISNRSIEAVVLGE